MFRLSTPQHFGVLGHAPDDSERHPMNRTTYALNLAHVAGAARSCAVTGLAVAGNAEVMAVASHRDWSQNFRTPTTKRSTRRHRPPLT